MNPIHITRDGQSMGPYTLEQVNEKLADGTLLPTDLGCPQGMTDWTPLNLIEGVVLPEIGTGTPPADNPQSGGFSAMGALCPQCNSAVPSGELVCAMCGTHIHAQPVPSQMGKGKLAAIIGGSVFVLALVAGGIIMAGKQGKSGGSGAGGGSFLSGLSESKRKANRMKCVNNLMQIYKANLGFAQDNKERLPWQLAPSGVRVHLNSMEGGSRGFGLPINPGINEVNAHPYTLQTAGVHGLTAMKMELQTPKILLSPCDTTRYAANEIVQENWRSYNTRANGVSAELGYGTSYTLVRGADTQRASSVLGVTRNWSGDRLDSGTWLGSDRDRGNPRVIGGLTFSQGHSVTMDGSARQCTNADFGEGGQYSRAARMATGGVARGQTSLRILRGPGL